MRSPDAAVIQPGLRRVRVRVLSRRGRPARGRRGPGPDRRANCDHFWGTFSSFIKLYYSILLITAVEESDPVAYDPHTSRRSMRILHSEDCSKVRWFGLVLMIASYAVWIPGITFDMYSYHSIFGDVTKSTVGTVDFLWNNGNRFPAVAVAFFGIAVPIGKVIFSVALSGRYLPYVQSLSRWATVDAFVALLIVLYLQAQSSLGIIADLLLGYSFFVSYCIMSSFAAVLMRIPTIQMSSKHDSTIWTAAVLATALAQLGFLAAVLAVPSVEVFPLKSPPRHFLCKRGIPHLPSGQALTHLVEFVLSCPFHSATTIRPLTHPSPIPTCSHPPFDHCPFKA